MKKHRLRENVPQGKPLTLFGADGNPIQVKGEIDLDFEVEGYHMNARFKIVKRLVFDMIIGLDVLKEHGATIDMINGIVYFGDHLVATPFSSGIEDYITTTKTAVILPFSEAIIAAKIDNKYKLQTSIIERLPNLHLKRIALARCVVSPKNCLVNVRVLNPTSATVYLKRKTKIGTIEPCQVDFVNNVNTDIDNESTKHQGVGKVSHTLSSPEDILSNLGIKVDREQLNEEDYQKMVIILAKNQDVFSKTPYDLPGTNVMQHRIETGDAAPVRARMYRTDAATRGRIEAEIQKLLKHDIIEESNSPWASNVVMVKKHDGTYRMCIDYRKLNAITKTSSVPQISIDDVVDALAESEAKVFSTIDLTKGYWQVGLDPETSEKTSLNSPLGVFKFKRLPMGLINSSAVFSSLMFSVLRGINFKHCLCYIDDVIVYSKDMTHHMSHLQEVFDRFRKANLRMNPAKCHFGLRQVQFLGHTITDAGIKPNEDKVRVMAEFPVPKNVKALRSFLSLVSFYRRYVYRHSEIVSPLLKLLRKDAEYIWDESCQAAFEKMKIAMTTAPILKLPVIGQQFYLLTDASRQAISYTLAQKNQDNIICPTMYGARSLSRTGEQLHCK